VIFTLFDILPGGKSKKKTKTQKQITSSGSIEIEACWFCSLFFVFGVVTE